MESKSKVDIRSWAHIRLMGMSSSWRCFLLLVIACLGYILYSNLDELVKLFDNSLGGLSFHHEDKNSFRLFGWEALTCEAVEIFNALGMLWQLIHECFDKRSMKVASLAEKRREENSKVIIGKKRRDGERYISNFVWLDRKEKKCSCFIWEIGEKREERSS